MARKIVRREVRKRGVVGWIFLIIFLAFNALMAMWLFGSWGVVGDQMAQTTSDAEQAGTALGGIVASTVILWIWLFGAIITGLLALLTRGGKTIVEEYERGE